MTGTPVAGSVRVCTSMPQPTPQYEQAVRVDASSAGQPAGGGDRPTCSPAWRARACIRRNTNHVTKAQTT